MASPQLILALCLTACAGFANAEEVAKLGDESLSAAVFSAFLQQRGIDEATLNTTHRRKLLDELIDQWLLAREAERLQHQELAEVQAQLQLQARAVLAQSLLAQIRQHALTDEKLQAAFAKIVQEREWRVRHILVARENDARRLIQSLQRGNDFAQLAAQHSRDATAQVGGDLGWLSAEVLGEALAAAVSELAVGQVAARPIRTAFGWHVIQLTDVRVHEPPDFAAMRPLLTERVFDQQVTEVLKTLRQQTSIRILR